MKEEAKWLKRYLSTAVGKKIVAVKVKTDDMGCWPILVLDDKTELEISQDEEGNGPGFIFGLQLRSR